MKRYIVAATLADGTEIRAIITTEREQTAFTELNGFNFKKGDLVYCVEANDEQIEDFKREL